LRHRTSLVLGDQSSAYARRADVTGQPWSLAVRAAPRTYGLSSGAGRVVPWAEAVGQSRPDALFISFPILNFVSIFLKIIQTSKIHSNSHKNHKNTK
jgi:hypothetical protein